MMEEGGVAVLSALWLGFLTSISPCPLATNIAAVSYIGKQIGRPWHAALAGFLYTVGRMLAYLVLGAVVVRSLMSVMDLSAFLQEGFHKILGPVLIAVGVLLLGFLKIKPGSGRFVDALRRRVEGTGLWGAFLLGIVFALSFCPISAGLFFGSLIGLATRHESVIVLPAAFGLGTGATVWAFALLLAFGTRALGWLYGRLTDFEKWARRLTAVVFILVGIYETVRSFFPTLLPW